MRRRKFISTASSAGLGAWGLISHNTVSARPSNDENARHHKDALLDNISESLIVISVKAIKAKNELCKAPPKITFASSDGGWRLTSQPDDHGDWYGENLREIYFNIETDAAEFTPVGAEITGVGIEVARVIVGYTDVPFEQRGNSLHFTLIDDRSRGQLMQLSYQNPLGGLPIAFIHNWEIRKAKEYALEDFPRVEFAAVNNYLVAAQEVLRQTENMGPDNKFFKGRLVLMGSEVAATRGHVDYPPHFHIMHYEFGEKEYVDWISRLVPHFYMDKQGNVNGNKYDLLNGSGTPSGFYKNGDVVRFEDSEGTRIVDLTIDRGGLKLDHPDGRSYSIRPDPVKGAAYAAYGYLGNKAICRAKVRDYPDIGTLKLEIEVLDGDKVVQRIRDGYQYDPFISHKFGKLYAD